MEHWRRYVSHIPDWLQAAAGLPAVMRLRQVGMNCGCEYTHFPRLAHLMPYSRWDHSAGVALLLLRWGQSRECVLAGLFHDLMTPVFAHSVDFLNGDYLKQESTEEGLLDLITNDREISDFLAQLGIAPKQVSSDRMYPLLNQDAPRLCADRLEYSLGNMVNYGFASETEMAEIMKDVVPGCAEGGIMEPVFQHPEQALAFSQKSLACCRVYVCDEDRYAMQRLSEVLALAISRNCLSREELMGREPDVIRRMHSDPAVKQAFDRFVSMEELTRADRPGSGTGWRRIQAKKRYMDPLVRGRGRVSEIYSEYAEELGSYLAQSQDVWLTDIRDAGT